MPDDLLLANGRIVTRDAIIAGSVAVRGGTIVAVESGPTALAAALDLEGDYLIPGLVELHTDNMERHFAPRPGVRWPAASAIRAHDGELVASAITTVLDALALGDANPDSPRVTRFAEMAAAVQALAASGEARAQHFLHLRCELTYEGVLDVFTPMADDKLLRLVSIMDHTPGQRQYVDIGKYRTYYQGKYRLSDTEIAAFMDRQYQAHERFAAVHAAAILRLCHARKLPLASHDDATEAHVAEAVASGMTIAEFPTTLAAATAAHAHGLQVLMGAANVVLGGSHSGNISAQELARHSLLDLLSSDYVPSSLLEAAFALGEDPLSPSLPDMIAKVSAIPAGVIGLTDRGAIAPGLRADLAWIRVTPSGPVVRAVWRAGRRVH